MNELRHLTLENRNLLELVRIRDERYLLKPELYLPILRPCRVNVLLVADGGLDFSMNGFGLRTFVETLLTMPGFYVRFNLTIAHIGNVSDDGVMLGDPRIARSIKEFKFDDAAHFTPSMYDEVWLFGISTFYSRGNDANGVPYPSDRLSDAELRALSEFMDGGGGLFATGDHGALGVCLSGSIPRARSMRLWGDTSPDNAINEVSMTGPRRNDTNRIGPSAGSQFNDQSDEIPQTISPRIYTRRTLWWRYSFPHPLLCGPRGMIRVLPDHPHEGQCVEPTNPNQTDTFAGYTITEYPPAAGGGARPLPDVIATSTVLSGTTSGVKLATDAHSFGAIGAYDGHLAAVGRVVTDATWHHYVNVNLVGDASAPVGDPKRLGFLATAAGQAHLEDIKSYYRNIAVWIARPALIQCMRRRILWWLVWYERVLEAVLTRPDVELRKADLTILFDIGRHARDVLGLYASQCQSRRLALDLIVKYVPRDFFWRLDPWIPIPRKPRIPEPDPVPWFDYEPLLDAALGGALVAIREQFPDPGGNIRERVTDAALDRIIDRGVETAVALAARSATAAADQLRVPFRETKSRPVAPRRKGRKR